MPVLSPLRMSDPGGVLDMIAAEWGAPESYVVCGGNVASVFNWMGISLERQYHAVHSTAGMFPCGGMLYLEVSGREAVKLLEMLQPKKLAGLAIGRAAFIVFPTPEGAVDTEAVVVRVAEEVFWLSIGGTTRPPTWMFCALDSFSNVRLSVLNISSFNIKGPDRMAVMAALVSGEDVAKLYSIKPFESVVLRLKNGMESMVMRTLIGVELWGSPAVMRYAWEVLLKMPERVVPCGWEVLDVFRLECQQFSFFLAPLDINESTHIRDAGLGHLISSDRTDDFIGRSALEYPPCGGRFRVAGAICLDDGAEACPGDSLLEGVGAESCGYFASTSYSPQAGSHIAFVHVLTDVMTGAVLRGYDGSSWRITQLPIPLTADDD